MKYRTYESRHYRKSLRKLLMAGLIDTNTIDYITHELAAGKQLDPKYRDHPLRGNLAHLRECHVRPDTLLLYELREQELILLLINIGSHSQLFR
jgi:mRNA interferase YafQ